MDSENSETTPLLHMHVPLRSVYAGGVVLQPLSDDVLIVKESLLSRVALMALAATIGALSTTFLYWFLQPLLNGQARCCIVRSAIQPCVDIEKNSSYGRSDWIVVAASCRTKAGYSAVARRALTHNAMPQSPDGFP